MKVHFCEHCQQEFKTGDSSACRLCGNPLTVRDPATIRHSDAVHHPRHYNTGKIEVIEAIEDWKLGFCLGNVVKYVARAEHKNGIEDLRKALWYLRREIETQEKQAAEADRAEERAIARARSKQVGAKDLAGASGVA